jgi:hypothetical protein
MKKALSLIIISCFLFSCNNNKSAELKNDTVVINNDTVPDVRTNIKTTPIVTYQEKVKDELNDWNFAVQIFETKKTFHFLMKVKYKEVFGNDTLKIPNFGIDPKIEIHQGKEKNSCIVGFIDKQNIFREYKLVAVKNDELQIKTLKHYGVYNTTKTY